MHSTAWQQLQERVANRKILIFGLGLQGGGVGVANTLVRAGAQVRTTDAKSEQELQHSLQQLDPSVQGTYGHHDPADLEWADLIIKNPAVPYDIPLLASAIAAGKTITTETALALDIVRDRTIGITGTRGKTTTTALIHHLLQQDGKDVILCGNIPEQPTLAALEQASNETWFVVEISSFQIEGMLFTKTSPHYAVVTNVFPDHLNRYATLETYARMKAALFAFQKPDDKAFWGTQHDWAGLFASSIQPGVEQHPVSLEMIQTARELETKLPGEHNRQNIALATEVARAFGVSEESIRRGVASFRGVPYRLEEVAQKNGITYVNDTTSTTPIALEKALEAQTQKFVLLCGGTSKKLPFSPTLLEKMRTLPSAIVFLNGSGTQELLSQAGEITVPHTVVSSLAEAVLQAETFCHEEQAPILLFSPGFSSFELFTNEFDRGDQFTALARTTV